MELATARPASSGQLTLSDRAKDGHSSRNHGPLKITDPVAFQKMLEDMRAKAEEQRALAAKREAERAKREGSDDFVAQKTAGDGAVSRKVDATRDYYATLGVDSCASVAEIRAAYKKLALLYHPDKHKAEDPAQQAAVADKFREAAEAFEVLVDERTRAVYDKVRDYQGSNPGRGLPVLSPEEAALMAAGAAELRRLRRLGVKHAKHAPTSRSVTLTLGELHLGCMKTATFTRRRVDDHGIEHDAERTFYLVVRRGSRAGDVLTFEGEGDETVDTQPGDLLVRLEARPHSTLRAIAAGSGKDLEFFGGLLRRGQFWTTVEVPTPSGRTRLVSAMVLSQLLAGGGAGGSWRGTVKGQGLFDHGDPWGKPPGDLHVTVRYPALGWTDRSLHINSRPGPVFLVGSGADSSSGSFTEGASSWALLGGVLGSRLVHKQLSWELSSVPAEILPPSPWVGHGRYPRVVVINLDSGAQGTLLSEKKTNSIVNRLEAIFARALRASVAGYSIVPTEKDSWQMIHGLPLMEEEQDAMQSADVMVLVGEVHPGCNDNSDFLLSTLRRLHCQGAIVVAAGTAAMGLLSDADVLPWYRAVCGEADGGWRTLQATAAGSNHETQRVFVGVPATAICEVDPATGRAKMVVSPPTRLLVAAASWDVEDADGVSEAMDSFGYFMALDKIKVM